MFLNATTTKIQDRTISKPSWINLLNRIVFLFSFLTRGLLDSNLIEQQTDDQLSYDCGIYQNFGADEAQLAERAKNNVTLNYALDDKNNSETQSSKQSLMNLNEATQIEVIKKQMLDWYFFKNGLLMPQIDKKSTQECVKEGIRLINYSLFTKQE